MEMLLINDVIYQEVRGRDTHTYTLYELSNGDVTNIAKLICLFIDFFTLDWHYNHNGQQIHYKPKPTAAYPNIVNLDIYLYHGYLNTGFICHDLWNTSLNIIAPILFIVEHIIALLIEAKFFSCIWIAKEVHGLL